MQGKCRASLKWKEEKKDECEKEMSKKELPMEKLAKLE